MFIIDGIVYGGESDEMMKVSDIKILPDRIMILTFSNGEKRLFDSSILQEGIYERLKDDAVFNSASIEHGVVIWENGAIDCAPEFMYKNSYEYHYECAIIYGRRDKTENGMIPHNAVNWD